jgi:hypothetical protein
VSEPLNYPSGLEELSQVCALPGHLFSPTFVPPRRDDAIAALIDECSKRNPQPWETRIPLFASWSAWAIKAGEPVLAAIAHNASTLAAASCGLSPSGKCRFGSLATGSAGFVYQFMTAYTREQT